MALQMVGPSDMRKYNPDRDMLWALHRFFKMALEQFGDGTDETLRKLMKQQGIHAPQISLQGDMSVFVKRLVNALTDPHLKETRNPGKKAEELLIELFGDKSPGQTALRTLFSVMFLRGIICELPLWAAMTRPKSSNEPLPDLGLIEDAARDFLNKLPAAEGDAASVE